MLATSGCGMMKGGVETGDLRQRGVQLRKRRNRSEMMRLMQRRQRDKTAQLGNDAFIDTDRPG